MQNLKYSDGSEKNMGQKTTDARVRSQHDCMIVRVCQKHTYNEAKHSVQFVSGIQRVRSFRTSFCDTSGSSDYHSEENVEPKTND